MVTVPPKDQVPPKRSGADQGPIEKDFGLAILRDGTWTYLGSPIRRVPLIRLFASVMRCEADGSYWLETPVERGRLEVEDVPFVAVEMEVTGDGDEQVIRLRTSVDDWVTVGPEHPLCCRRPSWPDPGDDVLVPYVTVRGNLEARIDRAIYYDLIELGTIGPGDQGAGFGVWSQGAFFPLDHEVAQASGAEIEDA